MTLSDAGAAATGCVSSTRGFIDIVVLNLVTVVGVITFGSAMGVPVAYGLLFEALAKLLEVGDSESLEFIEHICVDTNFPGEGSNRRWLEGDTGFKNGMRRPTKLFEHDLGRASQVSRLIRYPRSLVQPAQELCVDGCRARLHVRPAVGDRHYRLATAIHKFANSLPKQTCAVLALFWWQRR